MLLRYFHIVNALEARAVGAIGDADRAQPLLDARRHAEPLQVTTRPPVDVGARVGLRRDVAERIVGGVDRDGCGAGRCHRLRQAVQGVVGEGVVDVEPRIVALLQVADLVPGAGEAPDRAAGLSGGDVRQETCISSSV